MLETVIVEVPYEPALTVVSGDALRLYVAVDGVTVMLVDWVAWL